MNHPPDADAAFAALRAADPDVMDRDDLAVFARRLAQHRSWCDALQVRIARRQRQLAAEGRAEPPKDLFSRCGAESGRDARRADEREQTCTAFPSFEDALAGGDIASGHVDAVAGAVRNLDAEARSEFMAAERDLLADATRQRVDEFERNCRDLARAIQRSQATSDADELDRQREMSEVKRWVDRETGMCHTHLQLDPVRDRALWSSIDRQLARLRQADGNRRTGWTQLKVDAVISAASGGPGAERVPEITVLIDHRSLLQGAHDRTVCEADSGVPLPISTVRRWCCDAEILPAVLGGNGEVLDLGRSERTAGRSQRRALRAMHRTCIHPDCTVSVDQCKMHHVVPWFPNGRSDLANFAPLCERHHHLVHEGGWSLRLDHDRIATWIRPDGERYHTGPTIDRTRVAPATSHTGGAARR
ncbi:MAG: HNH endonuclease [Ilumatobacteraceae bacterium]